MSKLFFRISFITVVSLLAFSCAKVPQNVIIPQEVKSVIDTEGINAYDVSSLYGDWKCSKVYFNEYFDGQFVKTLDLSSLEGVGATLTLHKDGTTPQGLWLYQYNFLFITHKVEYPTVKSTFEVVSVDNEKLVLRQEVLPIGGASPSSESSSSKFTSFYKDKSGSHLFYVAEYERQ